ncbi:ribulose-phosphate 3-epimerase [Candidatus Woesearchaeota archaeon]|nr:ribulose-phosphate 3-epimerase [Candidatus Woesearchaeota archaeon]
MTQLILPSIMAKNQKELNQDFKKLKGVVKNLHLDVIDGKFAKNKTFQFRFKLSKSFTYSAHLMIKNPERWIGGNLKKVDLFIPHFEEIKQPEKYIKWIKSKRKKSAFAIRPETKIKNLKNLLPQLNYLLILTVKPGFYGSKFLKSKLRKIKQAKKINPKLKVIVDGGISPRTIKKAKKAGADFFVSGSYTTKADNPKERIATLMRAIQ